MSINRLQQIFLVMALFAFSGPTWAGVTGADGALVAARKCCACLLPMMLVQETWFEHPIHTDCKANVAPVWSKVENTLGDSFQKQMDNLRDLSKTAVAPDKQRVIDWAETRLVFYFRIKVAIAQQLLNGTQPLFNLTQSHEAQVDGMKQQLLEVADAALIKVCEEKVSIYSIEESDD